MPTHGGRPRSTATARSYIGTSDSPRPSPSRGRDWRRTSETDDLTTEYLESRFRTAQIRDQPSRQRPASLIGAASQWQITTVAVAHRQRPPAVTTRNSCPRSASMCPDHDRQGIRRRRLAGALHPWGVHATSWNSCTPGLLQSEVITLPSKVVPARTFGDVMRDQPSSARRRKGGGSRLSPPARSWVRQHKVTTASRRASNIYTGPLGLTGVAARLVGQPVDAAWPRPARRRSRRGPSGCPPMGSWSQPCWSE